MLMGVNLFVFSPGVSIAVLFNLLRGKQFFKNKDIHEYLMPEEGSEGNPIIDDIVGEKAVRVLKYIRNVFYVIILILFVFGPLYIA